MAFSGDLLKINSQAVPKLKQYKISYSKLWKNADRNMDGAVSATLIGVFPKLELEFGGVLTEDDISSIATKLNAAYFSVAYFDVKQKATRTAQFYASDYTASLMDKAKGLYEPFTVSLVPVGKM